MRIRLIRKLADAIDGVSIADHAVGDVIDLDAREAQLLIAEGWAVLLRESARDEIRQSTIPMHVDQAADSARRNVVAHLRRASELIAGEQFELPHGRRREDVLLDELHDGCPRTTDTDKV